MTNTDCLVNDSKTMYIEISIKTPANILSNKMVNRGGGGGSMSSHDVTSRQYGGI